MEEVKDAIESSSQQPTTIVSTMTTVTGNGTNVTQVNSQIVEDFEPDPKWEITPLEKASYDCAEIYNDPSSSQPVVNNASVNEDVSSKPQNEDNVELHSMMNAVPEVSEEQQTPIQDEKVELENEILTQEIVEDAEPSKQDEEKKPTEDIADDPNNVNAFSNLTGIIDLPDSHNQQDDATFNSCILSQTSVDAQMEKVIDNIVELGGCQQFAQTLEQHGEVIDQVKEVEHIQREIIGERGLVSNSNQTNIDAKPTTEEMVSHVNVEESNVQNDLSQLPDLKQEQLIVPKAIEPSSLDALKFNIEESDIKDNKSLKESTTDMTTIDSVMHRNDETQDVERSIEDTLLGDGVSGQVLDANYSIEDKITDTNENTGKEISKESTFESEKLTEESDKILEQSQNDLEESQKVPEESMMNLEESDIAPKEFEKKPEESKETPKESNETMGELEDALKGSEETPEESKDNPEESFLNEVQDKKTAKITLDEPEEKKPTRRSLRAPQDKKAVSLDRSKDKSLQPQVKKSRSTIVHKNDEPEDVEQPTKDASLEDQIGKQVLEDNFSGKDESDDANENNEEETPAELDFKPEESKRIRRRTFIEDAKDKKATKLTLNESREKKPTRRSLRAPEDKKAVKRSLEEPKDESLQPPVIKPRLTNRRLSSRATIATSLPSTRSDSIEPTDAKKYQCVYGCTYSTDRLNNIVWHMNLKRGSCEKAMEAFRNKTQEDILKLRHSNSNRKGSTR